MADIFKRKSQHTVKDIDVAYAVVLQHIFDQYRVIHVVQIFKARRFFQIKIPQKGHPSNGNKSLK